MASDKSLKILEVSTVDTGGGAARAANRLHNALLQSGCDSMMFVARRQTRDPTVVPFIPSASLPARFRRIARLVSIKGRFRLYTLNDRASVFEIFNDDRSMFGNSLLSQIPPCDVINLHWVANFIDYRPFFRHVALKSKVVWTLHDMNPFTGGCHYDNGCGKYAHQCGACPQLGSDRENDLSQKIWKRKQTAFGQLDPEQMHIVTPSRWLANEVKRSSLLGRFPVSVIPNGIDTEEFIRFESRFARLALGIPEESKVVFFIADSVRNQRKGFQFLAKALTTLKNMQGLFLLSVGSGSPEVDPDIPQLHLGRMSSDRLLSLAYSSADVFVIPSLQDNLPNTVLEAFACGTPVVGFDVGGIPDMVRPGITGELANRGSVKELSNRIESLLSHEPLRRRMSNNCRRAAETEYSLKAQADKYIQLYTSLVSQDNDRLERMDERYKESAVRFEDSQDGAQSGRERSSNQAA